MNPILNLIVLLAIGGAGWFIFARLNLPAAGVLGSLTMVLLAGYLGHSAGELPVILMPALQVLLGVHIGSMVNRESIKEFRKILLPGAIVAAWSIAFTLVFGYCLSRLTNFDLTTAILSSTPGGGVVEVGVISAAVNANVAAVTFLHLFRLLFVILIFPWVIKLQNFQWDKLKSKLPFFSSSPDNPDPEPDGSHEHTSGALSLQFFLSRLEQITAEYRELSSWSILILPAAAISGGFLAHVAGVPAGWMIGSMLGVGILSILSSRSYSLPEPILNWVFVGFGIFVAQLFSFGAGGNIQGLYASNLHALLKMGMSLTGALLLSAILIALLIRKVTGWNFNTCLLAVAPGGLATMTALAVELEGDPLKVSMLHVLRLLIVKISLPVIILFTMR